MLSILLFILVLIVLILVHEFGHFIVAKAFGIRVDEFGIFFPPRLFGIKWGETTYTFNSIPVGGFVKIFGETAEDEKKEGVVKNPRSFVHKPRWIQAAVIVAGIVCNILFAWIVLSAGYVIGMQSAVDHIGIGTVRDAKVTILGVLPHSPAEQAGLQTNDVLQSLQTGTAQLPHGASSDETRAFIAAHDSESMILVVDRSGETKNFLAKPADGIVAGHKALGVELDDVGVLQLNPVLALVQGAIVTKEMTVQTATGLASFLYTILHGTANFASVSGPIGIVKIGSAAVHNGLVDTIFLAALISINLAIINIIPIPGLDGGRLLFIIIEGVRGKPISEKVATWATIAGFALLILLMLVVSYHDVVH